MCFSATASFIAGISLSVFGVFTVKMARRKAEIPFAMIPLLFGIQQLIEGMLWLSFHHQARVLNVSMTYLFTLFSHVLWPVYIPFAIGLVESVPWRTKAILVFRYIGSAFFSSHRFINIFGVLTLLLFVVAYWFYTEAFFSVWCFFSAILSFLIYLHLKLVRALATFSDEQHA